MELIVHINYAKKSTIDEVNKMLDEGWTVKLISAHSGDSGSYVGAYVVLEKK